ncbi:16470_t:CDS:10 [Gigaspora margarita]|uniref:Transcription elongation factor SPT5 n=1 Tax=Gigaspora margarita TaxID=4874 RepID=A0ABN7VAB9_GIGMA|nr:16470_t:CDS:10 [Gigaspora margarita]
MSHSEDNLSEDEDRYDDADGGWHDDEEFIERDDIDDFRASSRESRRVAMELDRKALEAENLDAEELAQQMNVRYGRRRGHHIQSDSSIPVQYIPDVHQPNMFVIRCKPGKEKDVVIQFMKQFKESEYSQHPLEILSVTCRDALKGYVYIEAWKLAHVQKAMTNINNLFLSQIKLVPLAERTHVLTIKRKDIKLKEGSWAKVKKGKYAGDLVQIAVVYEEGSTEVRIKCVPRIDEKDAKTMSVNPAKRKKSISTSTVKVYDRGYMEKDIKITNLNIDISPTMDEITQFLSATDADENNRSESSLGLPTKVRFSPGDEVEVIMGTERGIYGIVDIVDKDRVTFTRHKSTQQVTFLADSLAKRFNIGDHVQVLNGSHQGEAGMVVNIDKSKSTITLLSDTSMSEIKVFSKDLKKISESTNGRPSGAEYELHDLVQLISNTVGVIVNVDTNSYRVVELKDGVGVLSTYKQEEIIGKEDPRPSTTSLGKNQVVLKVGDTVQDSRNENREGKILYIYRKYAFVLSRGGFGEDGGVFVVECNSLTNNNSRTAGMALDKLNPEVLSAVPAQYQNPPQYRSNYNYGGRGRGGRGGRGGGYNRHRKPDPLIGQTVTIIKGPYKGFIGIVKETTVLMARVELHTNCQIVNVEKTKLHTIDSNGNSRPVVSAPDVSSGRNSREYSPAPSNYSGSSWQSSSARTPSWNGSRTPTWHNAMTPNTNTTEGSRTPSSFAEGSRTPAVHFSEGSRTPAWDLDSKTPAYNGLDGSRTPAWDIGSKTPAYAIDSGTRTPTWDNGFPSTPAAETPSFTAPTPAAETPGFTAQTPAADTPAFSAPTPANTGSLMIPSTPGPGPTTPANFLPQTPFVPASTIPTRGDFRQIKHDAVSSSKEWLTTDIQVRIVPDSRTSSSHANGQHDNRVGVIIRLESPTTCFVELDDTKEHCFVEQRYLKPVLPQKKERIKMIGGEHKGQLGMLVGVDGADGVVKVKGGKDFKIVNMTMMAKYMGEEVTEE